MKISISLPVSGLPGEKDRHWLLTIAQFAILRFPRRYCKKNMAAQGVCPCSIENDTNNSIAE